MKEKCPSRKRFTAPGGISDGKQGNMRGMFIISEWYAQIITLSFRGNVEEKVCIKSRSGLAGRTLCTLCLSLADEIIRSARLIYLLLCETFSCKL